MSGAGPSQAANIASGEAHPSADGCVFCALVEGRLPARRVYEDADHVAFLPLKHIQPGHTLLIPRRHVPYVFEMDDGAYHALWSTAKRLAPVVRAAAQAQRVGIAVEGFSVPHVHVHLVPVNALNDLHLSEDHALADNEADRRASRLRELFAHGGAR